MKILFNLFILALVSVWASAVPLRAEEHTGPTIITSGPTVGGYVESSIQIVNAPPSAYKAWLINKRQQALLAFNRESMFTHNFFGNPAYQQLALKRYHLALVFNNAPIQTIGQPPSYAYFDSPGGLAGPYGTYLFPDNTVWRLTHPQITTTIGVSQGNGGGHPVPLPPRIFPTINPPIPPIPFGNHSTNSVPVR